MYMYTRMFSSMFMKRIFGNKKTITELHSICTSSNSQCKQTALFRESMQQIPLCLNKVKRQTATCLYWKTLLVTNLSTVQNWNNINTNVKNNVILFKYEKPNYFRNLRIFGVIQMFVWFGISYMTYTIGTFKTSETQTIWQKLKRNGFQYLLYFTVTIAGPSVFFLTWMLCKRTIKYLILHKGGKQVTFITYDPIAKYTHNCFPLNKVTAMYSRKSQRVYLPLKVQGVRFYYLIDLEGKFINGELFDYTVGLSK